MASKCPKCNYTLKWTDLKPQCPKCNTNLLYYKIEERLEVDAINAEIEHAHTQKKLDRAKASYAGNVLAFVRDGLLLLTLAAFLLPLAKMAAAGPYFDDSKTFTAIDLVDRLMNMDFAVFNLTGSSVVGHTTVLFAAALGCVVLAMLMALLQLILSFLACSPKGFIRSVFFSVLGIGFSIGASVTFGMFISSMNEILPGFMTGSVGFGIYVVAAMFLLVLAINIIIKVKGGVPVKYKQCYVGKDAIPFEEFVAKYGDQKITLETVLANRDEFMKKKEAAEQEKEPAEAEA